MPGEAFSGLYTFNCRQDWEFVGGMPANWFMQVTPSHASQHIPPKSAPPPLFYLPPRVRECETV